MARAIRARLDRLQTHIPGLDAVLAGGLYLVKVSHRELLADRRAPSESVPELLAAAREGEPMEFAVDMAEVHFFDLESGETLTEHEAAHV
jgi:hypothetical protein